MAVIQDLRDLNHRAEGYARITLANVREHSWQNADESHSDGLIAHNRGLRLALGALTLKAYYVFSLPLVTMIARTELLMRLARTLVGPTRIVLRKLIR